MEIGLTSDKYKNIPITTILYFFRWLGVQFSEVTVNIFNQPEKSLQSARGMKLGLHLPNFGNYGYDFSSMRCRRKIETILHQIHLNREKFHFQYAVFHPPEEPSFYDLWDFYLTNLKQVGIPHAFLSEGDWKRFYTVLKSDIRVIHLSDCTEKKDLHLPFGLEGTLPFEKILKTLGETGFNGILNFEIKPVSLSNMNTYFNTLS